MSNNCAKHNIAILRVINKQMLAQHQDALQSIGASKHAMTARNNNSAFVADTFGAVLSAA